MFTSWIKRFLLFCCLSTPVYCHSLKISVPNYSKFESIGTDYYEVNVSENGLILNIFCKESDGTERNWNIETQKNIPVSEETSKSSFIIKVFKASYYILQNGMLYTAYQNIDNIQFRYEFFNKSEDVAEVLCSINRGDLKKNIYDTYSDKIKITGKRFFSKNKEDQIYNVRMVMKTGLAEVLLPYILFEEDVFFRPKIRYAASSELKEKSTVYSADNLKTIEGNPWATNQLENVELFLDIPVKSNVEIDFYNGFQNPNKSYLYEYNSRAKDIMIVNLCNRKSKRICLKDTLQKQILDLTDIIQNEGETAKIKIKIESVYEGTKYKDLCIQAILTE